MKLGLISCTKSKQTHPCSAAEMYQPSSLFSKAYTYATKCYDQNCILSAKYGLLLPEDPIEPYEKTLKNMGVQAKRDWSKRVLVQMDERLKLHPGDEVYIHAGKDYREYLIPGLRRRGLKVHIPLEGLSFGKQLQWYEKHECLE
ncbi:MAG: hypothetical protein NWF07_03985 [Candidatus Bathyarchaeota archaeon]|nr:hypothetical protein [Candidatus Bathyarchaeota archaeon]